MRGFLKLWTFLGGDKIDYDNRAGRFHHVSLREAVIRFRGLGEIQRFSKLCCVAFKELN